MCSSSCRICFCLSRFLDLILRATGDGAWDGGRGRLRSGFVAVPLPSFLFLCLLFFPGLRYHSHPSRSLFTVHIFSIIRFFSSIFFFFSQRLPGSRRTTRCCAETSQQERGPFWFYSRPKFLGMHPRYRELACQFFLCMYSIGISVGLFSDHSISQLTTSKIGDHCWSGRLYVWLSTKQSH